MTSCEAGGDSNGLGTGGKLAGGRIGLGGTGATRGLGKKEVAGCSTGSGDFGSTFTCTVRGAGIGSEAPGTGRSGCGGTVLARGRIVFWRRFAGVLDTRDDPAADELLAALLPHAGRGAIHAGGGANGGGGAIDGPGPAVNVAGRGGPWALSCIAGALLVVAAGCRSLPWKRIG